MVVQESACLADVVHDVDPAGLADDLLGGGVTAGCEGLVLPAVVEEDLGPLGALGGLRPFVGDLLLEVGDQRGARFSTPNSYPRLVRSARVSRTFSLVSWSFDSHFTLSPREPRRAPTTTAPKPPAPRTRRAGSRRWRPRPRPRRCPVRTDRRARCAPFRPADPSGPRATPHTIDTRSSSPSPMEAARTTRQPCGPLSQSTASSQRGGTTYGRSGSRDEPRVHHAHRCGSAPDSHRTSPTGSDGSATNRGSGGWAGPLDVAVSDWILAEVPTAVRLIGISNNA
jgi:hypothetical protein